MKKILIVFILSFGLVLGGSLSANAATLTVTKVADTNDGVCAADCSLREAIAVAASGDTVVFASPVFDTPQTITLDPAFGQLFVAQPMTINARGADLLTIAADFQSFRVFVLTQSATLSGMNIVGGRDVGNGNKLGGGVSNLGANSTIIGCVIAGNAIRGTVSALGAGVYNDIGKTLNIVNTLIYENYATRGPVGTPDGGAGGGVFNSDGATLNIINSTIARNAAGSGGGIFAFGLGTSVNILNSTITANYSSTASETAGGAGGGLYLQATAPKFRIQNSILNGNAAASLVGNDYFPFPPSQIFLVEDHNNIGPAAIPITGLSMNGGHTPTYALAPGSTAVNAGNNCVLVANGCGFTHPALSTDQRGTGYARNGGIVDIGSFELLGIVTNINDSGPGSLRNAVATASVVGGGGVAFDPAFFATPRTINLFDGGQIVVNKDLTVAGPGRDLLTLYSFDGNETTNRIFYIDGGATLNLSRVKITAAGVPTNTSDGGGININNGTLNADDVSITASARNGGAIYNNGTLKLSNSLLTGSGSGSGGGIYNETGKTATVVNSTISNNSSVFVAGAGIYNKGTISVTGSTISNNLNYNATIAAGVLTATGGVTTINNSTISGNRCVNQGGGCGAYIQAGSSLSITNTTITNNLSNANLTGGVINLGTFTARNSIISGNRNANGTGTQEVSGVITSGGYNLLGNTTGNSYTGVTTGNLVGAANLAPLGNYGGTTETHALGANSLAIDAGDTANVFALDQRGSTRPIGGRGDIGSFERNIGIDQTTLRNGNRLVPYSHQFSATRSSLIEAASTFEDSYRSIPEETNFAPTSFNLVTVSGQSLPPGLTLSSSGLLAGTPTTEGVFTFTVRSIDTDGMAGAQQYTMYVFSPTAANVSVSGRVSTAEGNGLRGAQVVITDSSGNSRTTVTGSFGYFRFAEVEAGQTYSVSIISKRFEFSPRIISVSDDIIELNFTAQ